jgi:chemotaxis protein methyltransferase CheR
MLARGIYREVPMQMQEANTDATELEDIEIRLLLEGVYLHYGYDFREYAPVSLKRRISEFARSEAVGSISELQGRILREAACFDRFVLALTVNVTSMFRDPAFYVAFRSKAVPLLKTYPFVRIWHAGCSTGEEVYSLAILLKEEGIYDRCRIYATDINEAVLRRARSGIYPLKMLESYEANYLKARGKGLFSEYYTEKYESAILRASLRQNILFSQHNLVGGGSFNEFNVILCRNVLIYFNKALQDRVHELFYGSLCMFGILCLGSKETLKLTARESHYEELVGSERMYRRIS